MQYAPQFIFFNTMRPHSWHARTQKRLMRYSGDADDVCAITCVPVKELSRPVGFDTAHAFECESIVEWITKKRNTNPVTGQTVSNAAVACLLRPLIVDENAEHVAETQIILNSSGWVVGAEKVIYILFIPVVCIG